MNGYYQIPLSKLKVTKDKIEFNLNGKSYEYSPRSKQLLKIIKKSNYKLSKVQIGFMLKQDKVISNDNIEIIKKRIVEVSPNSELFIPKKKRKRVRKKKNLTKKSDEPEKNRKAELKEKETKSNFKKLSHRFRSISIGLNNIEFGIDILIIRYGQYKFNEKTKGSEIIFNTLKRRKEITFRSIPIKINSEVVIIEDTMKTKLIDQFNLAKANYNLEVNKTISSEISKSNLKKNKNSKISDVEEVHDSFNWKMVQFYDGRISYNNNWFIERRSKQYLNHLKPFFSSKSFSYKIHLKNRKITSIGISHDIFSMVKLAKKVDDILSIKRSRKKGDLNFTLTNYNLESSDVLSIFGKSKTLYLEYLFVSHIDKFDIICIPEPVYQSSVLIKRDISFIFYVGNKEQPTIIWESVEPNKASYLFKIEYEKYSLDLVVKTIQTFLLLEEPYKRSILQSASHKLIEGVKSIKALRHQYYSNEDYVWVNNIKKEIDSCR